MTGTMPARDTGKKKTPLLVWRMGLNITQQDAAGRLGVSFSTYRRLELLTRLPRTYALALEALKKQSG